MRVSIVLWVGVIPLQNRYRHREETETEGERDEQQTFMENDFQRIIVICMQFGSIHRLMNGS